MRIKYKLIKCSILILLEHCLNLDHVSDMVDISVFTLNCWGIGMGVSKDRVFRFRAIAQYLADSDYDIVCLQEVWCSSDYRTIMSV